MFTKIIKGLYLNNFQLRIVLIAVLLLLNNLVLSQNYIDQNKLRSNFAKHENKEKYYANLIKNSEYTLLQKSKVNSDQLRKALRDVQSILLKSNAVYEGLEYVLNLTIDKKLKLQRVALEVAYSLYPNSFNEEAFRIINKSNDPISISISALYLIGNKTNTIRQEEILNKIQKKK